MQVMKIIKRIRGLSYALMSVLFLCAGIFFAVLALNGCSKKDDNKVTTKKVKLDTGEISEASIVMSVGGVGVEYREMRNYCYLLKCQYEKSFGKNLWNYSVGEGTIGDEVKQEIVNTITQMKVIEKTAQEQDIALTPDEKDEAIQKAEKILKSATAKDKENYFLTVQGMTELYEEHILANKMFYIATDEADTDITDEEAKQISIQYLQIMTEGVDKNGTKISMNAATKKSAMLRIKHLKSSINKPSEFLDIAQQNTDSTETELVIGRDTDKLEKAVVDAAFKLKKNEISGVITGENGYYIVRCVNPNDEDATYARKEEIIEERQTEMFKEKYSAWLKNCDVQISEGFWDEFTI